MKPSLWLGLILSAGSLLPAQTSPVRAPRPKKAPAKSAVVSAADVDSLRDALAAQQQQMEQQRQQMDQLKSQLQQLLDASQQAGANAQKVQSSAEQAQTTAAQAQQSAAEAQRLADQASANAVEAKTALALINTKSQETDKKLGSLGELAGRFRFNGDVRIRGESFFQDCPTSCPDRNRARIRVRFGVDGRLNEDFVAGFSLATGTLGDPTTTNETLTNFFDRKTIALDRAYIVYNPVALHWLSLTGGKFAYNWNRTQVTGDPDINPEGFSEKFSFDLNHPLVKNLTFQLMQTLFNESSTGTDSYTLAAQVAAKLQIGPLTTTPSFMIMKWNNPDAILNASAFAVAASPGEGPGCQNPSGVSSPNCVFAANKLTNATYTDGSGLSHFYSQFLYADFILNSQVKTGWSRLPLNVLLEFENNLDAKDHPLDSTGAVVTSLGKQSHTYVAEVSLGQVKTKNDIQIGYSWLRQEQDSVIASFADSDQRAPTNILQNRFYALWKLRANTVAGYTFWYGRTLNSNLQHAVLASGTTPGETEPHLRRMQFDLIYSF